MRFGVTQRMRWPGYHEGRFEEEQVAELDGAVERACVVVPGIEARDARGAPADGLGTRRRQPKPGERVAAVEDDDGRQPTLFETGSDEHAEVEARAEAGAEHLTRES